MPQPASSPAVSNSAFLRTLAASAPTGSHLWVTSFPGSPDLTDAGNWHGKPYNAATMAAEVDGWGSLNTYFCPSALWVTADGAIKRRKGNFKRLLALVADDADLSSILGTPSWALETSPGKHQIGFFIDRGCPDAGTAAICERVINAMAQRGLVRVDSSGNNIVRYVRLPLGSNLKPRESGPWAVRLDRWAPAASYSLADAAAAFGVDIDNLRQSDAPAKASSAGLVASAGQDERLRVLTANVLRGDALHDSVNQIAASMVSSGMPGGAVVNMLRAMLEASHAAKDERWQARYADIPRAVSTAEEKFRREIVSPATMTADDEMRADALPLVYSEDIDQSSIRLDQLVEDTLTAGALSVMYGESNSGKSFLCCDMDCALASGMDWMGKRTVMGAVLYVAGEGCESIKMRVLAWRQHHGVAPNLAVVPVAINLLEAGADVARVIKAAEEVREHYGMPVVKITIDTLARAFGGGNENASEDMGAVIINADKIRAATGAHVMFVHHAGKDAAKGSRGHSSLKAATDTEIEVTADDATKLHTARITKQRDLNSRGTELSARFLSVEMGRDQWGKPITTCVVEPSQDKPATKSDRSKAGELKSAIRVALATAHNWQMRRAELAAAMQAGGFSSAAVYRALDTMADAGELTLVTGLVHLNRG